MEVLNLSLPTRQSFVTDYLAQNEEIQRFFHYRFSHKGDDELRLQELRNRSFQRSELANYLNDYMRKFPTSLQVEESIKKLRHNDSVVVIGGQQAGILTGPLYSIHKIISIIKLANEKEKELNVPVIPVFWIAGEDHDYDEVNHIFINNGGTLKKKVYPERVFEKDMISNLTLDHELCMHWVHGVIEQLGESEHTGGLIQFAKSAIDKSSTFVDFFAYMIMELFKEHGLLIIDSADRGLRQLESPYFYRMIEEFEGITNAVKSKQAELQSLGINNTIEIKENAANLFYYDELHKERVLLEYDHHGSFLGKSGTIRISIDELKSIAERTPEQLSNNVVTRPIMQDLLFPTIAFIGGPGEIAYWGELQGAFEHLQLKMPPIVPRLNFTLLERAIESELKELSIDLIDALTKGATAEKEMYLSSVRHHEVRDLLESAQRDISKTYQQIRSELEQKDRGLLPLLQKNEELIIKQLHFMDGKVEESVQRKYETILSKFDRIESSLRPNGGPQERTWNMFYFLNKYGLGLFNEIISQPLSFDGTHKVIKL
jgi:bacillithiol biosynthesis cysteine-adding enzyme BshC